MTDDQKNIIKLSLAEHAKVFDHISNIYDQLRIKALALIAGEVAIVSFLFSGWDFKKTVFDDDRVFLFGTGIAALALAFSLLLWIISTIEWRMPHNLEKSDQLLNDKNRDREDTFLKYIHDDYVNVNIKNNQKVTSKCKKFNWSLYLLAGGVIMIMVIKFGGPQV